MATVTLVDSVEIETTAPSGHVAFGSGVNIVASGPDGKFRRQYFTSPPNATYRKIAFGAGQYVIDTSASFGPGRRSIGPHALSMPGSLL